MKRDNILILNDPARVDEFKKLATKHLHADGPEWDGLTLSNLTSEEAERIYDAAQEEGIDVDWGWCQPIDDLKKIIPGLQVKE